MVTESLLTRMVTLVVEYDGTRYHGFQLQRQQPTVQGEIEQALEKLTGERIRIIGASRTDAGVHARGQVIGFRTKSALSVDTFVSGLNYYLPEDISIRSSCMMTDNFGIRREAKSREYRYTILNRTTQSPLERYQACLVTVPLDILTMNLACKALIGTHDFASFTKRDHTVNTVRTVFKAEMCKVDDYVFFDVVADSFLQQQVRRTVGALIEVGIGKSNVQTFKELVELPIFGKARPTAPAHGLCLIAVNYAD